MMYTSGMLCLHQEIYSGAVDAEIGVWGSGLLNRPVVPTAKDEATTKGQEVLRDIYEAFVGN